MFLWVIVPAARKDYVVAALVCASFFLSYIAIQLPGLADLSSGTRTIVLTVAIAAAGAYFFPVREEGIDATDTTHTADRTRGMNETDGTTGTTETNGTRATKETERDEDE